jgi:hypothetical protein
MQQSRLAFYRACGILASMAHRHPHPIPASTEKDDPAALQSTCVNKASLVSGSGYQSLLKRSFNVRFEAPTRLFRRNTMSDKKGDRK